MEEKKINLANLPTPIEKSEFLSKKYNNNIYIKRDDFTGTEVSGNKIRKLEYVLKDALDNQSNVIITTGAIQSNHCRATAAACAKLGLECHIVLVGQTQEFEGNLFLDKLLGAKVHLVEDEEEREQVIENIKTNLKNEGKTSYYIPVGASTSLGSLGYEECFEEILKQEKDLNIRFDTIFTAVGSGGTYAGLWYGNYKHSANKEIIGISVSNSKLEFIEKIKSILLDRDKDIENFDNINIIDKYIGQGYAKFTRKEIETYMDIARNTGLILDPCYTGKGFIGMLKELENIENRNILFIHTGGLQGWTKDMRTEVEKILK